MDIVSIVPIIQTSNAVVSYENALKTKKAKVLEALSTHTLESVVPLFLASLSPATARTYKYALRRLMKVNLKPEITITEFSLINVQDLLDSLITESGVSRSVKTVRASSLISFTKYLNRKTEGITPIAVPIKTGGARTFLRQREKSSTTPLTKSDCLQFIDAMKLVDFPTSVMVKLTLNAGRRIQEVLNLKMKDADFENNKISFTVSKLQFEKIVRIQLSNEIFDELRLLKRYSIRKDRDAPLFQRGNGSPLSYMTVKNRFERASFKIQKKVNPHQLRTTFISLASQAKATPLQIRGVTGHSSSSMVEYYDHSTEEGKLAETFSIV